MAADTQIIPYLIYRDVAAALAWLSRAFGFSETMRTGTASGGIHAEMTLNGAPIMLGQMAGSAAQGAASAQSHAVFIYLPDVDAHYARARAAGAEIAAAPRDLPYGRSYTAHDPEGHVWYFTTPPA